MIAYTLAKERTRQHTARRPRSNTTSFSFLPSQSSWLSSDTCSWGGSLYRSSWCSGLMDHRRVLCRDRQLCTFKPWLGMWASWWSSRGVPQQRCSTSLRLSSWKAFLVTSWLMRVIALVYDHCGAWIESLLNVEKANLLSNNCVLYRVFLQTLIFDAYYYLSLRAGVVWK